MLSIRVLKTDKDTNSPNFIIFWSMFKDEGELWDKYCFPFSVLACGTDKDSSDCERRLYWVTDLVSYHNKYRVEIMSILLWSFLLFNFLLITRAHWQNHGVYLKVNENKTLNVLTGRWVLVWFFPNVAKSFLFFINVISNEMLDTHCIKSALLRCFYILLRL